MNYEQIEPLKAKEVAPKPASPQYQRDMYNPPTDRGPGKRRTGQNPSEYTKWARDAERRALEERAQKKKKRKLVLNNCKLPKET